MRRLRDTPIRGKLTLIMLMTAGVAMLIATLSSAVLERQQFFRNRAVSLSAIADILAINSNFALSVQDANDALSVLTAVKVEPDIRVSAIYDEEGILLAAYRREDTGPEEVPEMAPSDAPVRIQWQSIELTRPVEFDNRRIGTIYLLSDTTLIRSRLWRHVQILFVVLIGSLLGAYLLSARLQKVISDPILALNSAAGNVTEKKDYSIRVAIPGKDELGVLTRAFNEMLAAIEFQNQALEQSNEELEERVRTRTAELKTREEELRLTVAGARVGTWLWDIATDKLTLSDRSRQIFGLAEAAESSFAEFLQSVHPEDRNITDESINQAIKSRSEFQCQFRVVADRGGLRWVEMIGAATHEADGSQRMMRGIVLDITERKRAEAALEEHAQKLERSNRELDSFAYVASHDLKSPLRAIKNLSNWISKDCEELLPEESRNDLNLLQERVERMEALLDALLQYSRIGRTDNECEEVDVDLLLKDIIEMQDRPEGFEIVTKGKMPLLIAPRGALYRVFGNLIGNAIKHHDRTDGKIEVACRRIGRFQEFTISDDGPGIPEQFHERIFKMFQRLKPSNAGGADGSGMGLTLVKKTVEIHGGSISLESEEGKGASFRFTWPDNRAH